MTLSQFQPSGGHPPPEPQPGQAPADPGRADNARSKWLAWYQASRPPFYIATFIPLLLALALAGRATGQWRVGLFLLINLGAFMVHLATNLADDLFDHLLGADAGVSIGGSRVVQEGKISLDALAWALVILYSSALLIAALVIHGICGRPAIWSLVVLAGFSSLFYVAPPVKYGYRGLGELSVFINMGLIMVGGAYWVLAGAWRWDIFLFSLPIGLMVSNILYYQSIPDMDTDRSVGKITLAVRLGRTGVPLVFRLWWAATYAGIILLWVLNLASWAAWLSLLSLPLFFKADRLIRTTDDWLELDQHGHLIRKLYFINGLLLILAVGTA